MCPIEATVGGRPKYENISSTSPGKQPLWGLSQLQMNLADLARVLSGSRAGSTNFHDAFSPIANKNRKNIAIWPNYFPKFPTTKISHKFLIMNLIFCNRIETGIWPLSLRESFVKSFSSVAAVGLLYWSVKTDIWNDLFFTLLHCCNLWEWLTAAFTTI